MQIFFKSAWVEDMSQRLARTSQEVFRVG